MNDEEMNLRNAEFMQMMRAGNFEGAHAALDAFARDRSLTDATYAAWKAHILQFEGRPDDASAVLAPLIAIDDIPGKFLRHHRAAIFIHAGKLEEARADLQALLQDDHPRIEALHVGCAIQLAYIMAVQGDPQFTDIFDVIPEGSDYVIKDSILGKDELKNLFRANSKQSPAPCSSAR